MCIVLGKSIQCLNIKYDVIFLSVWVGFVEILFQVDEVSFYS